MTSRAKLEAPQAADGNPYERDFYTWAMQQAALLRERRLDELDVENVAEEVESLGRSEAKELRSAFRVLLTDLLKWRYQPRRRSKSWRNTMGRERDNVPLILRDNPGLKSRRAELFAEAYRLARKDAMRESGLRLDTFPAECPYSLEQVLDDRIERLQQHRPQQLLGRDRGGRPIGESSAANSRSSAARAALAIARIARSG